MGDADHFDIRFPLDLDVKMKAMIFGACFLIVSLLLLSYLERFILSDEKQHSRKAIALKLDQLLSLPLTSYMFYEEFNTSFCLLIYQVEIKTLTISVYKY